MKTNTKCGILFSLIASVAGAVVLVISSAGSKAPSKAEMRQALERKLASFAPDGAVGCGMVEKGAERREAIGCVRERIDKPAPFVVAFQEQGEDSDVWSGLVGNSDGQMQWLIFDSSPHGEPQQRAEYFLTLARCSKPELYETGPGAIGCAAHQEP
jgi:hypothetical protein